MPLSARRYLSLAILLLGLALVIAAYHHSSIDFRWTALVVSIAVALIPPLRRFFLIRATAFAEFLFHRRKLAILLCIVFAAASSLFYIAGRAPGLCLRMHDDHVYMIQAQMLAIGHLWMHPYPASIQPFFDSFHLLMHPVYGGMYQPGTALVLTPGVWFHWPFWAMPIMASSLSAGVLYLILNEFFGPLRALLGILMVTLGYWFRYLSTAALSELPLLLGSLLLFYAWLRWRTSRKKFWAIVLGASAGYCAITRPLDALCFCPVIGLLILFEFRRSLRLLLITFLTITLSAMPFLVLLAIQNHGLSGHWYVLGESDYLRHVYPASPVGFFHLDYSRLPQNPGIEKQTWLARYILPTYEHHTVANTIRWLYPDFFCDLILVTLPHAALFPLALLGLFAMRDIRSLAILLILIVFLFAYACVVFFLFQYLFPMTLAMTCLVFLGWDKLLVIFPNHRNALGGFLFSTIFCLSIAQLPAFNAEIRESAIDLHDREQRLANAALANIPSPAIVLFRFDPNLCDPHDEPVYNDDVPFPDSARIIRARDLGLAHDLTLIDYYAASQPNRMIYIYDRAAALRTGNGLSQPLGSAAELAHRF